MSLKFLEEFVFTKRSGQLPQIPFSSLEPIDQLVHETILARNDIVNFLGVPGKERVKSVQERKEKYINTIRSKADES